MTSTTYIVRAPASCAGWRLNVLVKKFLHMKKNRPHQAGVVIGSCCLHRIVGVRLWEPTVQLSAYAMLRPVALAFHLAFVDYVAETSSCSSLARA